MGVATTPAASAAMAIRTEVKRMVFDWTEEEVCGDAFARRGFYAAVELPGYSERTALIPDGVVQLFYLGTVLFRGVYREGVGLPVGAARGLHIPLQTLVCGPMSSWGCHLRYDSESKCAIK
jgi:hypothetical protein